jgi:hypothetical protein
VSCNYNRANILAGNFDGYVSSWVSAARAYGKPIYLRFAHEMNGNWHPWGVGVNGNTPAQYVSVWRKIVTMFRTGGATNVRFVWSPNVVDTDKPLTGLYPGDAYVDMTAMDGYNWGTARAGAGGWRSFNQIFRSTYDQILALAPTKPIRRRDRVHGVRRRQARLDPGDLQRHPDQLPEARRGHLVRPEQGNELAGRLVGGLADRVPRGGRSHRLAGQPAMTPTAATRSSSRRRRPTGLSGRPDEYDRPMGIPGGGPSVSWRRHRPSEGVNLRRGPTSTSTRQRVFKAGTPVVGAARVSGGGYGTSWYRSSPRV